MVPTQHGADGCTNLVLANAVDYFLACARRRTGGGSFASNFQPRDLFRQRVGGRAPASYLL